MNMDPKELKRSTLSQSPVEKAFWFCRGDKAENIQELADGIESLTTEQFHHHVSVKDHRNDFSAWIEHVLSNPILAKDLMYPANLSDQKHFVKTIRDHVAWLETL